MSLIRADFKGVKKAVLSEGRRHAALPQVQVDVSTGRTMGLMQMEVDIKSAGFCEGHN